MGWTTEESGLYSKQRQGNVIVSETSKSAVQFMQRSVKQVAGGLCRSLLQTGREDDYRSPPRAEAKNEWSYASNPHMWSMDAQGLLSI